MAACVAGLMLGASSQAAPGAAEAGSKPKPKPDPVFAPVTEVKGLPRILLIGDSISMGYTLRVRELLAGKANVHRIPTNGGPTSRGLQSIDAWLGKGPWDVIHFNWGLHDLKRMPDGSPQVSLEQYTENLEALVARLKRTGATLIWCSTTPVPDGDLNPPRSNADVIAYNAAAAAIMATNGIAIDDLYAFAAPQLDAIQRPVNVHFTAAGSEALAGAVARVLEHTLTDGAKQ